MEFILPSHVYNIPVPEEAMQSQTITLLLQILQLEPHNQDEMPVFPYGKNKPLQGCQKSDEKQKNLSQFLNKCYGCVFT